MSEPSNIPTVRHTGGIAVAKGYSVLGDREHDIPVTGKIRPGIKVLVKSYAGNPTAAEIYKRGVDSGLGSSAIEAEIRAALKLPDDKKSIMTPKNTPYFIVRGSDFVVPEIASRLMEMYGEDRGEGFHLYAFPVVFPLDNWLKVLPHGLKTFRRSGLLYWSEYGDDGVRYCKMHAPATMDAKAQRAVRRFGGRPHILRPENDGRCAPEQCPEYQQGECKLTGKLIFYVPKIPGAGAIALPTTSYYGMDGIHSQLSLMMSARGRISGTWNGEPMFWLTKVLDEVSMLDPKTGEPKRVKQWITVLEGRLDMTKLLASPENEDEDDDDFGAEARERDDDIVLYDHEYSNQVDDNPVDDEADEPEAPIEHEPETLSGPPTIKELQKDIVKRLKPLSIPWSEFIPFAEEVHGVDWKSDVKLLANIVDELDQVDADNPEQVAAYQVRVSGRSPF